MQAGKLTILLAAIGVAAFLSACGGGDSTSSLSKAEFIKQADAICRKTDTAQLAAASTAMKEVPGQGRAKLEKVVVAALLPPVQKEVKDVSALPAPAGDEEQITAILADFEKSSQELEENPLGILNGSVVTVDKGARRYGFKACSEPL